MEARRAAHAHLLLQGGQVCPAGAFAWFSLSFRTRRWRSARPETVWLCAGQRWYLLIDMAVAIKCFGVGCSYLVVIGDLMPEAMHQLAPAATLLHQVRSRLCIHYAEVEQSALWSPLRNPICGRERI
jgi:hypothetical protein